MQDAEQHAAPRGTFKESKNPSQFQGYVVAMSNIIHAEPCTFEEATKEQVWKDAMTKENEFIIQNMSVKSFLELKVNLLRFQIVVSY